MLTLEYLFATEDGYATSSNWVLEEVKSFIHLAGISCDGFDKEHMDGPLPSKLIGVQDLASRNTPDTKKL